MFWANSYALPPHIEALLNKKNVTLLELMDQDEIVPECKSQNKKLVEYLTRPEVMEELVSLITDPPECEVQRQWMFKYANLACELLTCNVPTLNETLAGSDKLLMKLYSFLDTDKPLNPLLASFVSKIIGVLLTRKSDQVLEFLKSRQMCVDRLLQHLETSAIMDLVFKFVTKVEGSDMRQNILNWLDSQQLVQQLIKLLSPTSEPARHANAGQLLCDIIKSARESIREFKIVCTERAEPDPILNRLESKETISLLFDTILTTEQLETSIVGGIQVLLVLLGQDSNDITREPDKQGNSSSEEAQDNADRMKNIYWYMTVQNATLPYLEELQKLLLNPPPKEAVKTTAGLLEVPLGNTRLHIAKLITALLAIPNIKVFEKLAHLEIFQILLDLFSKYCWNNFLHTQIEQCLGFVINGDWQENSNVVYTHIFTECKLIERILEAWDGNDDQQNKKNGIRQGYMGHLIVIANHIVKKAEKQPEFNEFLKNNLDADCLEKWETLVNTQLCKINKIQEIQLVEDSQKYAISLEDNTDQFHPYPQDPCIQRIYATYQAQMLPVPFDDFHGVRDDEFNDNNDALQPSNSVDQLNIIPFTLSEEDLIRQEETFDKICQQKQRVSLDDSWNEWGDDGDLTFQTVIDKRDWLFQQQRDSQSSDEDEDNRDLTMEIDSSDPWASSDQLSDNNVLPEVNPWKTNTSASEDTTGWANFDNFDSTLNITESNVQSNVINTVEEQEEEEEEEEEEGKKVVPETTTDKKDDTISVEKFKAVENIAVSNSTEQKDTEPNVETNSDRKICENTFQSSSSKPKTDSDEKDLKCHDRGLEKSKEEFHDLTTL